MPIRFASKAFEAPRLQALETRDLFQQQNRKGKIVMTKTSRHKGLVLGSFLVPEIDMIFGDGVGASLVTLEASAVPLQVLNEELQKAMARMYFEHHLP